MGIRNTQGEPAVCNHCGYKWYTNSQAPITSCPHCGWRVRLKQHSYRVGRSPASAFHRDRGPLI